MEYLFRGLALPLGGAARLGPRRQELTSRKISSSRLLLRLLLKPDVKTRNHAVGNHNDISLR